MAAILRAVGSYDPNEILGPEGVGALGYVAAGTPLDYTILFENDPELAQVPAYAVTLTQALDDDFDLASFELVSFGFGDHVFDIPTGLAAYQARFPVEQANGTLLLLDVFAAVNFATRELLVQLRNLDPSTGRPPEDVDGGFLPPNVNNGTAGQGFFSYRVAALPTSAQGVAALGSRNETEILPRTLTAQASIVFDTNAPILTSVISNAIDEDAPTLQGVSVVAILNSSVVLATLVNATDVGSGLDAQRLDLPTSTGMRTLSAPGSESLQVPRDLWDSSRPEDARLRLVDAVGNALVVPFCTQGGSTCQLVVSTSTSMPDTTQSSLNRNQSSTPTSVTAESSPGATRSQSTTASASVTRASATTTESASTANSSVTATAVATSTAGEMVQNGTVSTAEEMVQNGTASTAGDVVRNGTTTDAGEVEINGTTTATTTATGVQRETTTSAGEMVQPSGTPPSSVSLPQSTQVGSSTSSISAEQTVTEARPTESPREDDAGIVLVVFMLPQRLALLSDADVGVLGQLVALAVRQALMLHSSVLTRRVDAQVSTAGQPEGSSNASIAIRIEFNVTSDQVAAWFQSNTSSTEAEAMMPMEVVFHNTTLQGVARLNAQSNGDDDAPDPGGTGPSVLVIAVATAVSGLIVVVLGVMVYYCKRWRAERQKIHSFAGTELSTLSGGTTPMYNTRDIAEEHAFN